MSDGPQNNLQNNEKTLSYQDLIIINKCLEKGFQKNIYDFQERNLAKHEHEKITKLIETIEKEIKERQNKDK